jgi:hypothetical protein
MVSLRAHSATGEPVTPTLSQAVYADREASFFRLRGGYPVPLAGAIWWAALGLLGFRVPVHLWILIAFASSGLIFPLAILLARILRNNFLSDRTCVADAQFPALVPMVLFWPIAFAAYPTQPALVPLILAIGLSVAWPVMGWLYGRTALFTTHALVRALVAFILWTWFPSTRFTWLPLSVAIIYLLTIAAVLVTSSESARLRLKPIIVPSLEDAA